jgi:hypothetical protein
VPERYFTLHQAEALLPEVERRIRQAIQIRNEHTASEDAFNQYRRRVAFSGGMIVDRSQLLSLRARRDALVMRLKEILTEIEALGVQVKDLDTGLLDFPTMYHGEVVLLCWRLGEDRIRYWHGLEEGFRGRKEIDSDFLSHHRGDSME